VAFAVVIDATRPKAPSDITQVGLVEDGGGRALKLGPGGVVGA